MNRGRISSFPLSLALNLDLGFPQSTSEIVLAKLGSSLNINTETQYAMLDRNDPTHKISLNNTVQPLFGGGSPFDPTVGSNGMLTNGHGGWCGNVDPFGRILDPMGNPSDATLGNNWWRDVRLNEILSTSDPVGLPVPSYHYMIQRSARLAAEWTDLKKLLLVLKAELPGHVCKHSKTQTGFFSTKWGCGRTVASGDRCKQVGPNRKKTIAFLMDRYSKSKEEAAEKITELRKAGLITTYSCGALFYNNKAEA